MKKNICILVLGILVGIVVSSLVFRNARITLETEYEKLNNYILDYEELGGFKEIKDTNFEQFHTKKNDEKITLSNMVYFEEIELLSLGFIHNEDPNDYTTEICVNDECGYLFTTGRTTYYGIQYERLFYKGVVPEEGDEIKIVVYTNDLEPILVDLYIYEGK